MQHSCSHYNAFRSPQLQETHRTTHTGTTTRCKTHRRNNSRQKRPQPHPSHADELPFIAGCSHFTRKNTRFRAPASSPKHSPCNIHAAITMRFAAHSFKKRIELRTQEQPLVAKHIGGTIRDRNDPSRTRRTDELPFIVACSHFTRKNTRFRAPASSPKHSPCNIHAAITMRFAAHSFKKRIELRTQEQPLVAKHIGGTIRDRNDPAAPVAQTSYLSSPAAATLRGKTQGFVLQLPPQNIAHATFMQPLQCVSQPTASRNA